MVAELKLAEAKVKAEEIVHQRIGTEYWEKLNKFDQFLSQQVQPDFKLVNRFTPGLYIRELTMPVNSLLTSGIHMLEHPFLISKGVCSVWDDENGWQTSTAPYTGITKPGTRRLLFIHEETTWTTFHVTEKTDVDEILKDIVYDHLKLGHISEIPRDRKPEAIT